MAWVVRAFNEVELAAQLEYAKVNANDNVMFVRDSDFRFGMTHTVNGETFKVQLRIEDRINLIGMQIVGKEMIAAGMVDELQEFRSYENTSVMLTPQQCVDMAMAALEAVKSIYKTTWTLKDQIDSAATVADIPVIPGTFIPVH